ncbi:MAG: hypothetical protein KF708_09300 [Pirellulales bacterium]|nr:hypothetical protein [Pirellulales bacterium]
MIRTLSLVVVVALAACCVSFASEASAQGVWPPKGKLRVGPLIPDVQTMPPMVAPGPSDIAGRPVWLLPIGTKLTFRDDRLIMPNRTKYEIGTGPTMANQFMYLRPSGQQRTLEAGVPYTVKRIGPVFGKKIYPEDLQQSRNRIYMELESEAGTVLELAITPGGAITPSVGQFAQYFDIALPPVEMLR